MLRHCSRLNIIFDASEDINHFRVMNISIQVPQGEVFYWSIFDLSLLKLTATNHIPILEPVLRDITEGNLAKINLFTTDTYSTIRAVH